jgi:hypothetical protein
LFILENDRIKIHEDGLSLYSDEDHLTAQGALFVRPIFEMIFKELKNP